MQQRFNFAALLMIYRFKIRFEDEEDFVSVVEVSTKHSFYHLHDIMQTAIGFNKKQEAAIFTANDNWKPIKEIPIPSNYFSILQENGKIPLISTHIFDPYQKFVYVADRENEWVLEVELMKIADDEAKVTYPNIKRTEGFPPRQFIADLIIDDESSADQPDTEPPAMPSFDKLSAALADDKPANESTEKSESATEEPSLEDFPDLGDIDELDFSEEV